MPRFCVVTGAPCSTAAAPPITMYSTPAAFSASRSASGSVGLGFDTAQRRKLRPVGARPQAIPRREGEEPIDQRAINLVRHLASPSFRFAARHFIPVPHTRATPLVRGHYPTPPIATSEGLSKIPCVSDLDLVRFSCLCVSVMSAGVVEPGARRIGPENRGRNLCKPIWKPARSRGVAFWIVVGGVHRLLMPQRCQDTLAL